jgi:hypothetical protein
MVGFYLMNACSVPEWKPGSRPEPLMYPSNRVHGTPTRHLGSFGMMTPPSVLLLTPLVLSSFCEQHAAPGPWLEVMWLNT